MFKGLISQAPNDWKSDSSRKNMRLISEISRWTNVVNESKQAQEHFSNAVLISELYERFCSGLVRHSWI